MSGTFVNQDNLPSLPVPSLNHTLDRYLYSAKALVNTSDLSNTKKVVEEFRNSQQAQQLQDALENKAKNSRNWLEKWWYDVYNEVREPLTPFLSLATTNSFYPSLVGSQLTRAADIAHYWMKFWNALRNETVPVMKSRGVTWDMHQYKFVQNFYLDDWIKFYLNEEISKKKFMNKLNDAGEREKFSEADCPSHICVFCRGNIWKVEMVHNQQILTPDEIYQILSYISKNSENDTHSIISMTTEHRDVWAKVRSSLQTGSSRNKENLQWIENSVFCMTLADDVILDENRMQEAAMMNKSHLVWVDKCLNLVVYADGQLGLLGDHSNVDAIVVLHAGEEAATKVRKEIWNPQRCEFTKPSKLVFDLSEEHMSSIEKAKAKYDQLKKLFRVKVVRYQGYGNDRLRSLKLYTDTVVQIVLQLAFAKVHGSLAPIYETASTRKFYHARTETVRGCTPEFVEFSKAVFENRSVNEQKTLFKSAYDAHNTLMAECMNGQGIDRHLLGLRKTWEEFSKGCSPKQREIGIFSDPTWKKCGGDGNFLLSTSFTGYMLEEEDGTYGYVCAMKADGYGIFYKIAKNRILLVTTDWKDSRSNLEAYSQALIWAFDHIGNILEKKSTSHI